MLCANVSEKISNAVTYFVLIEIFKSVEIEFSFFELHEIFYPTCKFRRIYIVALDIPRCILLGLPEVATRAPVQVSPLLGVASIPRLAPLGHHWPNLGSYPGFGVSPDTHPLCREGVLIISFYEVLEDPHCLVWIILTQDGVPVLLHDPLAELADAGVAERTDGARDVGGRGRRCWAAEGALDLSKIWSFSRNPHSHTFSHGFSHEKFENDDNFAVRVH